METMSLEKFLGFLYTTGFIVVITYSQYIDNADYDDTEIYGDLSSNHKLNDNSYNSVNHNDFYISKELMNSDESITLPQSKRNSNKILEKVYRYTKHRIPGYDYDEFDLNNVKSAPHRCDEKSVWTHCLCQFTCAKLDTVDCYTPCISGCECKENYVFDEDTHQCVYPEDCCINDRDAIL